MSYQQGNMKIDEESDGKAKVTARNSLNGRWVEASIFRGNRQNAAQALAGGDYAVLPAAEVERLRMQESRAENAISRLLAVEGTAAEAAEASKDLDTAYVRNKPSSSEHPAQPDVAGNCPSCQHPRLVLAEYGRLRCTNPDCVDPNAALKALVDSDLRCRCGTRKTEDNPNCAWHATGGSHRGWVIAKASEFADLLDTVNELIEELRLNVEFVGIDVLQPWPGWGWYDTLKKHMSQFDEWLAAMPSHGTSRLATEASEHDSIDNVLATLEFAKEVIENIEDPDEAEENQAYIEQLDRLINTCEHVRRDMRNDDTTPANEDSEGSNGGEALLGVVPAHDNATYPFVDGDTIVLGPETFAHTGGTVINWKGENYYPRPDPDQAWPPGLLPHERGETGRRTLHGIRAVLDTVEDLDTDDVKGRCPACGRYELGLDQSGRVLCSHEGCADPGAADRLLERGHIGESITVENLNPGDRVRAVFCTTGDERYVVEGEIPREIEGEAGGDRTLRVGGPARRVRTHSGHPDPLLDEVFILERAATSKEATEEDAQAQELGRALHRIECDKEGVDGDWDSLAEWAKGAYIDSAISLIRDHHVRVEQREGDSDD